MRGKEIAEVMAVVVDHLVNARENLVALDRGIETIVGMTCRFNGKHVISYLESYKVEILMRDIS